MAIMKVICNMFLYAASLLIPKSRKYVVIGGWQGQRYADNSRGMYEYLDAHKEELGIKRVFWFTKKREIYDDLKQRGKDVLFGRSVRSVYWHLRSKVHMIDQNTHDILNLCSLRCIRINLWHGIPLKKIGNYLPCEKKASWRDKYSAGGGWPDQYLLAPSEFSASLLAYAMGVKEEKCLIASYPRNEKLYGCKPRQDVKGRFHVFYLPTFRDVNDKNPLLLEDLEKINGQFAKHKIVFYIKPHYASMASWSMASNFSNIKILDAKEDVYDWLYQTDLLITDYSSVFFDYMITGRPMLFYPYDYEYYENQDRGFTISYDEYTPGRKIYHADQLLQAVLYIQSHYVSYMEEHRAQYQFVRKKMNRYLDGPDYSGILQFWNS